MDDLISRAEAIRVASGYCHWTNIPAELAKLPSVTPTPKMGRWKIKKASIHPYGNDVACSECGHTMASSFGYKYCPMCGCRMMKGVEE